MDHIAIARDLLALFCGIQGFATLAADLNRTHATNPLWLRHARFHVVSQAISAFLLSIIEVFLVLGRGPFEAQRFYLAATLACVPLVSFVGAMFTRTAYGGALHDPNGILPVRISIAGRVYFVHINVVIVFVGLLVIGAILGIRLW